MRANTVQASPAADAVAVDTLLRQTRWLAGNVETVSVMPGHVRRLEPAGIRFVHTADGRGRLTGPPGAPPTEAVSVGLLPAGFVLLPRGGEHRVRALSDRVRVVTGTLTAFPEPCNRLARLMPSVLLAQGVQDPAYASLLAMLDAEVNNGQECGSPLLGPLLDLVVSATLRASFQHSGASAHDILSRVADTLLTPALEAIHAEPGEPWTVESLARVAQVSRSVFAERFRATMGESPARYLARVRMSRAQEMLRDGVLVSRISHALGYSSEDGFRRAFRRHSGLSPSAWRAEAAAA